MKKLAIAGLVLLFGICVAAAAFAEGATKDECIAKSKEAAALVNDKGLDAAIKAINDKAGPFVWKDSYVFLMDLDGKMLAHPMSPGLIGKNLLDMKDKGTEGKLLFKEFVEVAKGKGEGWVDYMWPKPGAKESSKKLTYIYRGPGKDVFVGAGVYE